MFSACERFEREGGLFVFKSTMGCSIDFDSTYAICPAVKIAKCVCRGQRVTLVFVLGTSIQRILSTALRMTIRF